MAEMKTLNGYEVVDAAARAEIELLKAKDTDLSAYYTKTEADDNYATKTHNHSYNDLTDKPTIPSVTGLASEAYVDAAIANIDFPEPSGMELVNVTTYTTAEELQAILDAGKCPIFKGVLAYEGAFTPSFDGQPGEKFHLFAGVALQTTYPNDGNLYPILRVAKCYPDRELGNQWNQTATSTSPTGYRLVTKVEFDELKDRVAALEGGNN